MSDPIRLLDDPSFGGSVSSGGVSSGGVSNGGDARSLLELGRDVAPPADAQARGWSALQSVIGVASAGAALAAAKTASAAPAHVGGAAAQPAAPAATKTGAALGTKLGLVGLLVGAALIATTMVRKPPSTLSETPPASSFAQGGAADVGSDGVGWQSGDPHTGSRGFGSHTNAAPVAPKEAPAKEAEPDATQPSAPHAIAPAPTAAAAEAPVDRVSQLQRESTAVQEARSQLVANDGSGALKTLTQLDVDVPRGILGPERTVLTIDALKKSGQAAAAAQRAAAFIEANPKSPYADRLRAYLQ